MVCSASSAAGSIVEALILIAFQTLLELLDRQIAFSLKTREAAAGHDVTSLGFDVSASVPANGIDRRFVQSVVEGGYVNGNAASRRQKSPGLFDSMGAGG